MMRLVGALRAGDDFRYGGKAWVAMVPLSDAEGVVEWGVCDPDGGWHVLRFGAGESVDIRN